MKDLKKKKKEPSSILGHPAGVGELLGVGKEPHTLELVPEFYLFH